MSARSASCAGARRGDVRRVATRNLTTAERGRTACLWLLAAVCAGCGAREGDEPREPAAPKPMAADEVRLSDEALRRAGVRVEQVGEHALRSGTSVPAEVQLDPTSTAHVGPLSTGRIAKVAVQLGDAVRRGQLLGTVSSGDASTLRSRLAQLRTRLPPAEAALRRQEQLAREGIAAQRALLEAQSSALELRAEASGLEQQLQLLGSGQRGELSLTSPIDGVVVAVNGTLGETAGPDRPVFVVTDPSRVWVRGDVPELELSRLQLSAAALVRLHAYPELALRGTVTYIAPALDERTRSLPIRVSLETPDARLRSGMFGSIELASSAPGARTLAVPRTALTSLDGQDVVFVPGTAPGTFRPLPVSLGRSSGPLQEVRAGLSAGQPIVVSGVFTLKSVLRQSELGDGDDD